MFGKLVRANKGIWMLKRGIIRPIVVLWFALIFPVEWLVQ